MPVPSVLRSRPALPQRRVAGLLLLLVPTVLAGGCARTGDRVFVLGDSITSLGRPVLEEVLGGDHDLNIGARFGARSDQMGQAAQLGGSTHPDQVVINLGTNDVLQGRPTAQILASLEQLANGFGDADCVWIVTINTHLDQSGNRPRQPALDLNAALEELAGRDPRVELVRWDEIQDDAVDEEHPLGLTTDGVHPGDEGQRRLADAYADALGSC